MAREATVTEQRCPACRLTLPASSFHRATGRESGLACYCRECKRKRSRAYYERNREAVLEATRIYYEAHRDRRIEAMREYQRSRRDILAKTGRERHLRSKYGITHEIYEEMLVAQNHVCAVCYEPETLAFKKTGTPYALAVDHDHETGRIRGLLCSRCNVLVGQVERSPEAIERALEYLRISVE